jgi:hypothetical protein
MKLYIVYILRAGDVEHPWAKLVMKGVAINAAPG